MLYKILFELEYVKIDICLAFYKNYLTNTNFLFYSPFRADNDFI